jgi:hypothetical protein
MDSQRSISSSPSTKLFHPRSQKVLPSAELPPQEIPTFLSQSPSIEVAIKYREANSVRLIEGERIVKVPCGKLPLQLLGSYGVGLELYFRFLRYSFFLFLLISVISVWPLVLNRQGNYIPEGTEFSAFDVYTLANQKRVDENTSGELAYESIDTQRKYQQMILAADAIYTAMFIGFLIFYRLKSAILVKKNLEENVLPSDYAVEVKGLPPDVTEDTVKQHFSQFGEVVEVSFARKYEGKLFNYKKRSELTKKLETARLIAHEKGQESSSGIEKLNKQLANFDKKIARTSVKSNLYSHQHPVIRAFVIFNLHSSKQSCISTYQKATRWFQSIDTQPQNLKFQGDFPLKVSQPPEPSVLLWENLEVRAHQRLWRKLLTALCSLVLIILSVLLMYGLKVFFFSSYYDTCEFEEAYYSFEKIKEDTDSYDRFCWCKRQGITAIMNSSEYKSFCNEYIVFWTTSIISRVLSSLIIIIINLILKFTLRKLSSSERMSTVTKQQQKVTLMLFIAMFINTAFINLIVNIDLRDTNISKSITIYSGDFKDFDRNWYYFVGSGQVYTMLIAIASPHLLNLLIFFPIRRSKIFCCRRRKKTQSELNELYLGPEYDIASKTAVVLNIISSCFLYSGGIPLLNIICCVSLFLIYWIEKILVVNHYRAPPAYDHGVNQQLQAILPDAVILHCGFSLYMYGSESIWPQDFDATDYDPTYFDNTAIPVEMSLEDRIKHFTGITMIVMMSVTIIAVLLSQALAEIILKGRYSALSQTKIQVLEYTQARESLRLRGIASYNIMANPIYSPSSKLLMNPLLRMSSS